MSVPWRASVVKTVCQEDVLMSRKALDADDTSIPSLVTSFCSRTGLEVLSIHRLATARSSARIMPWGSRATISKQMQSRRERSDAVSSGTFSFHILA